ncbi:MAG: 5'-nucleotidase C-terminal domain-containing protein, partial [Thermoanaerobaculia bacterium]
FVAVSPGCVSTARAPRPSQGAPAASAGAPSAALSLEHVVIVSTADLHGALEGTDDRIEGASGKTLHRGGLDVFAGYVANLRAANPGRVLLLDAGDEFQGTLASNVSEGESVVQAFNLIGYTAAAVGNHEFDFGPSGSDSFARQPDQDPLGALKRNVERARYQLLSANIREKKTAARPSWLRPSTIVKVGSARIGIIGLITPITRSVTNPLNVQTLDFTDPVDETVAAAAELRKAGADAVVVVAHMGGSCSTVKDPAVTDSCDQEAESFRFARRIPAGTVDVFFGGHTHREVRTVLQGLPITQALSHGRAFGVTELWVNPRTHRALPERTVLRPHVPVCREVYAGTESCDPRKPPAGFELTPARYEGQPVVPDAAVARVMAPFIEQVAAQKRQPLGFSAEARFPRGHNDESVLGDLLTDALRDAVPGADFAITNSGGMRSDLKAGELTYGDIFEVLPFDNYLARLVLTGAELREVLRLGTNGEHGIFQVSGLRVSADWRKDSRAQERLRVTKADGSPLEDAALYTVATTDFLALGGDGLESVIGRMPRERVVILYDRGLLRDELIPALKKRGAAGPFKPVRDGRLTLLKDPGGETEARR